MKTLERFSEKDRNNQMVTPCGISSKSRTRIISNNSRMMEKLMKFSKLNNDGLELKRFDGIGLKEVYEISRGIEVNGKIREHGN